MIITYLREKYRVTPSVAAPGDTDPSGATAGLSTCAIDTIKYSLSLRRSRKVEKKAVKTKPKTLRRLRQWR